MKNRQRGYLLVLSVLSQLTKELDLSLVLANIIRPFTIIYVVSEQTRVFRATEIRLKPF